MKIALVSPYDFSFPGGVTNHIYSLERYLTRMGHEVKMFEALPVGGGMLAVGIPEYRLPMKV